MSQAKKTDIIAAILVTLITCCSFLILQSNQVIGQTNSSSSSSSSSGECVICIQVVPNCTPNQTIIGQTCEECAHCKDISFSSSSSSGGRITPCPLCPVQNPPPPGCFYDPNKNLGCPISCANLVCSSSSSGFISSSSSGEIPIIDLSQNFSGIWKGIIPTKFVRSKSPSAKIITLSLCVSDGELEGTINLPTVINNADVISQDPLSNKEVEIELADDEDNLYTARLKLLTNRRLTGILDNGTTFTARKLRANKDCSTLGTNKLRHR